MSRIHCWKWFGIVSLCTAFFGLLAPGGRLGAEEPPATAKAPVKTARFGMMVLKGEYSEGSSAPGVFGELKPRLADIIARLDKGAHDDRLNGLVLDLRLGEIGFGQVGELRAAIARVRTGGKKVYAFVRSAGNKDYQVATACDEVIMPSSGVLTITGLQAEVMFFKGMFDKLGIQADFIQMGSFKGAAEPYTRSQMSPEFRQQFEAVLDDYYAQMVDTIARDRKLDAQRVKQLIDEGMHPASAAQSAGLVDRIAYEDELQEQLKKTLDVNELALEKDYGKKKLDTDFSGFGGFVKLIEMMSGEQRAARPTKSPKVAVIYAVGPIVDAAAESVSLFDTQMVTADDTIKAIRQAEEDASVKALVLRVDSPGGSALASDLIWHEIVRAKKPVIASMGSTAASGGYYISMGCDKVFAEPGTLTGSIGVVGGKLAISGLLSKLGISTDIVARGKNAGALSSLDPFTPSQRDAWSRMMEDVYRQFTTKAAQGRKMELPKLELLAQGRIYTGRMAQTIGLVDQVGSLQDAIQEAKAQAGLKAADKVEILTLPKPKNFFEQLFENPAAEARGAEMRAAGAISPEMAELARKAAQLKQVFEKPAATIMPFEIRWR